MAETKRALATLLTNISDGGSNTAEEVRDAILTLFDGLYTDSTKSASFTAVEGSLYPISIASLGANIDVTFPATPAAGDTFGFYVAVENTTDSASSGFAVAPFWGVEPLATTDINNVSYTQAAGDGMGKWGLMSDGEILIFRYDAVTATWVVVQDGRVQHECYCTLAADTAASESANTWTNAGFDTAGVNVAGVYDTSGEVAKIKRANRYVIDQTCIPTTTIADAAVYWHGVYNSTSATIKYCTGITLAGVSSKPRSPAVATTPILAAATVLTPIYRSSEGSKGVEATASNDSTLSIREQL